MRIIEETVKIDSAKIRYILKNVLGFSAALLTKLKNQGGVTLNGEWAKLSDVAHMGDVIRVAVPYQSLTSVEPCNKAIDILYEDEDVICINKERGIPTHPSQGHRNDTLANRAVGYLMKTSDEFHIVTRLDNYTSGVVLAAKNAFSASVMCTKEYNQKLNKTYIGICRGIFESKKGIIEAPIARCEDSIIKRTVSPNGKYSKTGFCVLNDCESGSMVQFELFTGRTHQIRVHCAYIGHPLVNDFLYDADAEEGKMFCLHCESITFQHPYTGETITVHSHIPEYFKK